MRCCSPGVHRPQLENSSSFKQPDVLGQNRMLQSKKSNKLAMAKLSCNPENINIAMTPWVHGKMGTVSARCLDDSQIRKELSRWLPEQSWYKNSCKYSDTGGDCDMSFLLLYENMLMI
ncbi:hypothetical protein UY3_03456 [Chelonia mydas]|uniref:Uncharacterized protein n=1 Tax=Chelonia mydas TaxID=8469 RepID=M7BQ75_CHEMY|nr:hypothetical protein UY3_03456 [Chelonia mydas]